jgi:hypothetical protein
MKTALSFLPRSAKLDDAVDSFIARTAHGLADPGLATIFATWNAVFPMDRLGGTPAEFTGGRAKTPS